MAEEQVLPITYKPGILRDGSPFQGEYCTNGQWVRFFRGQPQNIGGIKNYVISINAVPAYFPPSSTPTAALIYYDSDGNKHILVGVSLVTQQHKYSLIDATYNNIGGQTSTYFTKFPNPTNTLTQFVVVTSIINAIPTKVILCLGMKNYTDINSSEAISAIFVKREIAVENTAFYQTTFPDFVYQEATGGMLYAGSRLFYYGNNGLVRWSSVAQEKSGKKTKLKLPFLFF